MFKRVFSIFSSVFLLLTLLGSAAGSIPTAAQEKKEPAKRQDEEPTISIGTELMQIDAVVTDKQGRLVDTLTKDDFVLTEDGKPQEVAFFSVVRGNKPPTVPLPTRTATASVLQPSVAPPVEVPEGRVTVLMVDDLHIAKENMPGVKRALTTYLKTQFREGDQIAVVSTGGGLGYLQQLTDNAEVAQTAVNKLSSHKRQVTTPTDPARLTEYQAQAILRGDAAALEIAVQTYIQNTQAPRPAAEQAVRTTSRQIVLDLALQTSATLQTLKNVTAMLQKVPGRKALLLASDGFILEYSERNHAQEMREIISAATRSGVVVYSVGSAGLVAVDPTGRDIESGGGSASAAIDATTQYALKSQEVTAYTEGLRSLAQETGGFAVLNTNDLRGAFQKIAKDNETYYLLAYYPENTRQDGKFRELKIVLRGRSDLTVRTRKGYVAPDAKEIAKKEAKEGKDKDIKLPTSTEELQKVLYSVVPLKELDIKSTGCFLLAGRDGKADNVNVSLAIRLGSVQFREASGNHRNDLNSVLVVINEEGKVTMALEDVIGLNFPEKNFNEALRSWFFFNKPLSLPPGLYNLRFAVRDPLGKTAATTSEWLRIPDLTKPQMAMSTIFLLRGNESRETDGKGGVQGSTTGMPKGFQPGIQALRQFPTESTLGFVTYIYNIPSNKPDLVVQIQIWKDRSPVIVAPLRSIPAKPDEFKRVAYGAQVPLTGLARGNYQLKLVVIDRNNKSQVSQDQDFNVL